MNKNFNIVWNTARNMYVVASEFAQGDSQIKNQARAAGIATLLGLLSGPAMADYTPTVVAGESVSGETLNATNDHQMVYGSAFNTTIEGGWQYVMDGGLSQDAQVTGGTLQIQENGTSVNAVLSGKGKQLVEGRAEHTTINSGARNYVYGTAVDSVINAGGTEHVFGLSSGATINNKGVQDVYGIVKNTTVNQGGTLVLSTHVDGGETASFASNTTVNSGGTLWLESDYAILEGTTLIKTGAIVNAETGVITNSGILDYDLDAGASRTESNSIQGIGSLQKTGQGTLLLTGNNTYAGDTLVDEGTLWLADSAVIGVPTVSGSSSQLMAYLPSGSVSVAAGATLGGTGVINDDVSNAGNIAISQSNETGHTLTINGNYTGNNGTLSLNTQLGDDASPTDKLLISGDTAGTTTVFVTNTGGDGALTTQGIEVIDVGGQSDGVFTQGNQVQVGLYEYRLYQDGGDWYLRSQTVTPVNPDDGGDVTPVNPDDGGNAVPVDPQYRADIGTYLGNQWMARNLQMQTLYDREGSQLRTDDGSMWMRFKAGDASSQAANGHVDIDNNYSQLQIGGDILSWDDSVQSLKAGLMVSYINADTDSTGNRGADGSQFSASGNVAGYNLGAYATWFADAKDHSGLYVDSWYQYGLYNNSVNNGDVGSKDYDSTASAVSLETGYRYDIGLENLNTVSLTPQAQVTWQQYKADAVVQNGTRIDGQNGDSWNTRLGLRVDGKLHKNTTSVIQPFAEVNWLHTSDDVAVSFDGVQVKQDLPADRAEVKVGIQANLNSQWSITGQVAGQKGRNDYGDLNGSLDVRYSW